MEVDDDTPSAIASLDALSTKKKCFTSVQVRRYWAPVATKTVALCPSMDLLTLGLGGGASSSSSGSSPQSSSSSSSAATLQAQPLWLHRTLSFQKLATVTVEEGSMARSVIPNNDTSDDDDDDDDDPLSTTMPRMQAAAWRPDGRWLATVTVDVEEMTGRKQPMLSLFNVEAMVAAGTLSSVALDDDVASSSSSSSMSNSSSCPTFGVDRSRLPLHVHMGGHAVRIPLDAYTMKAGGVAGLSWAHVGAWHPRLVALEQEDSVQDVYWKFRSRFVDRTAQLLPPSEYHNSTAGGASASSDGSALTSPSSLHQPDGEGAALQAGSIKPTSQTPLSLLAVASGKGKVDCFLHGRFPVAQGLSLSMPHSTAKATTTNHVSLASSNDLSYLIAHAHKSTTVSIYSMPALAWERHNWQSLTALYASIMGHFYALPARLQQVSESWKSSIKPLDLKMDGLVRLWRSYGMLAGGDDDDDTDAHDNIAAMKSYLTQYILSGHSLRAGNLSNALDQFFTGVQMNDQLLQRMERSLTVAVANVESLLRQTLAAGQALALETGELCGLARAVPHMLHPAAVQQLAEHAQVLFVALESALSCLVDARFRLRDWVAWLRSTGSHIKARGTATNSVQRENAKKRRVPDATVERILQYLQANNASSSRPASSQGGSLSEGLLGIALSHNWEASMENVVLGRAQSPRSTRMPLDSKPEPALREKTIPTLPFAMQKASEAAQNVWRHPRKFVSESLHRADLILPSGPRLKDDGESTRTEDNDDFYAPIALTTRLGAGGLSQEGLEYGEEAPSGFFDPCLASETERDGRRQRQWAVVAQATSSEKTKPQEMTTHVSNICLYAIPLPWRPTRAALLLEEKSTDDRDSMASFILTTQLSLPLEYTVRDMAFYGDDGKSGLFSGVDGGGTGQEKRQALAVLVSKRATDEEDENDKRGKTPATTSGEELGQVLELWLVAYDASLWANHDLPSLPLSTSTNDKNKVASTCYCLPERRPAHGIPVVPRTTSEEEEEDDDDDVQESDTFLKAKTREVGRVDSEKAAASCCLKVSGSRGIGVVLSNSSGAVVLEVLDLEENEEEEEDDDDNDEDMEE